MNVLKCKTLGTTMHRFAHACFLQEMADFMYMAFNRGSTGSPQWSGFRENPTNILTFIAGWVCDSIFRINRSSIWHVMLLTALNNTQLSQMLQLTVVVWLTLTMGQYQSLVQHTIQWPLTPVILAIFWWEMTRGHVWSLMSGLLVPQHVVSTVLVHVYTKTRCNSFHHIWCGIHVMFGSWHMLSLLDTVSLPKKVVITDLISLVGSSCRHSCGLWPSSITRQWQFWPTSDHHTWCCGHILVWWGLHS